MYDLCVPAAPDDCPSARLVDRRWADTWLLAGLAVLLLVPGLGGYPLWDPGEGRNAQAAREMADAGRWLVPLLYGEPYHDKPAPFFGLLRVVQAVLGEGELALRLPSVLATIATLLLVHRFALPRFGRAAAALAGVIYVTAPEVVALGRFCNFDATLSFCTTWATLAWLAWLDDRHRVPWAAWAAMGLGVLVKGPVAIVLPATVALVAAARRGVLGDALRAARPGLGVALLALLVLPWLVPAALAEPQYVRTFFLRHNVERYVSATFTHARGPLYFVPVIAGGFFPWSLLLPLVALPGARRGRAAELGAWAAIVILFFSVGQAKLATYVLPAFPALSLWLAVALAEVGGAASRHAATVVRAAVALWAAVLAALPLGLLVYLHATHPELTAVAALAAPLPVIAWLGTRRIVRARHAVATVCLAFAAGNVVVLATFYLRGAPVVSAVTSDAALAGPVRDAATPVYAYRVQPATLSYYARVDVRRTRDVREIRAAARRGPVLIVTRRRHLRALEEAGIPLHLWLDTRRHLLYATGPVS